VLSAIAATGAMLSILEVPVSVLSERFKISRVKSVIINVLLLALIGSTCALSNSVLADFKIAGLNMFDLFDELSSKVLMPAGGILLCLFVGWVWGKQNLQQALSNQGTLHNQTLVNGLFFIVRFVSPPLILLVMLKGLNIF
ncbi:MAG: hypothetical protein ACRC5N_06550, partial [Plesiomonas sp.]